jgi:hypothetical protein
MGLNNLVPLVCLILCAYMIVVVSGMIPSVCKNNWINVLRMRRSSLVSLAVPTRGPDPDPEPERPPSDTREASHAGIASHLMAEVAKHIDADQFGTFRLVCRDARDAVDRVRCGSASIFAIGLCRLLPMRVDIHKGLGADGVSLIFPRYTTGDAGAPDDAAESMALCEDVWGAMAHCGAAWKGEATVSIIVSSGMRVLPMLTALHGLEQTAAWGKVRRAYDSVTFTAWGAGFHVRCTAKM